MKMSKRPKANPANMHVGLPTVDGGRLVRPCLHVYLTTCSMVGMRGAVRLLPSTVGLFSRKGNCPERGVSGAQSPPCGTLGW